MGLHGLRHTNASLLGRAGVSLKVASDRLGHATVPITGDLYSHVFAAHDREAAAALGTLLEGQTPTRANESGSVRDQSVTETLSA
jgi:integrase